MNKKFSTLMLGLLLTSAFASAQTPASPVRINGVSTNAEQLGNPATDKTWAAGPYFIVADVDDSGTATVNDILLVANKNGNTLNYQGIQLAANNTLDLASASWYFNEEVVKDAVTGVASEYYYSLKNAGTAAYLTVNASGTVISDSKASSHDASKDQYAKFSVNANYDQFNQNDNLWINLASPKAFNLLAGSISKIDGISATTKFILCNLETKTLTPAEVAELNDVKGGSGFNLKFSSGNSNGWANDILTDLNLKAFVIDDDENIAGYQPIMWGGQGDLCEIPTGVYFATEYPASLNNTNVITTQAQFEACTFLAVNPDKNYDIHAADRANGIGFDLMTVSGADLNVYRDQSDDRASVKGDVFVGNACFTVEIPDPLRAENAYNLMLANARVQTDASKNAHVDKEVYIGSILDQNKNYLVTNLEAGALSFETTNSTLYDVTKLLKSEDAPSIYTIQFVSEFYKDENLNLGGVIVNFAGEKNQYLTVGTNVNNNDFALHSVEDYNAADPMFQFVITDVDKDNKTVDFTNRQTQMTFRVSLYENEDGSFTVYGQNALRIEAVNRNLTDENIMFINRAIANTKVILTPVTVEDKFATFVNRSDNDGLVTFELAKNVDDTPEFYVGARKGVNGIVDNSALLGYANARNMTQFELVKVDNDNDPSRDTPFTVTNPYVYKKGSRILTSTVEDTVAYYKYAIRVFEDQYVVAANYSMTRNNVGFFIIKENIDGSVSLIPSVRHLANSELAGPAGLALNYAAEGAGLRVDVANAAWQNGLNYDLASKLNVGLKTFMVEEDPAISYEAIPQHVSFEAVRGGFMTKDENSDARLSISTQAAEDLTFWLDTVHSDRNVPSFYILKNGAYMFNAADSANYYTPRGNDRFSIENGADKLIFKTGELVTSDTLRTTVDGRSVLVAEEDNAPKGIKGGLENFQFQIIQAEAGSDEYVIRQNGLYVCQTNNYFHLDWNRDQALRFVIEKQAAPTANEGIEVSGVKVIAGNGQITIMGAAGKQVVVSNILGKVVANQMITTDNATIAVPAGIIAVAVEGEPAVKAIVK